MLKIGIDAMGGDFAPEVAVEGAVMALKKIGKQSRIVLFGDKERILELLKKHNCAADNFDIVGTSEVIEMGDHPARAFVAKKDSSMTVGFRHLAEGKIDGFASAGSTGAMMVGCMQVIKPIKGRKDRLARVRDLLTALGKSGGRQVGLTVHQMTMALLFLPHKTIRLAFG